MIENQKLFELLKSKNLLSPEDISEIELAMKSNNFSNLDSFLLEHKIIGPEKLTEVKAEIYGIEYRNLLDLTIPEETLKLIKKDLAENYLAVCFEADENKMSVGLVNPNLKSMDAINFLGKQKKMNVQYFMISKISFNSIFKQYQKMEDQISSAIEIKAKEDQAELLEVKKEDEADILNMEDSESAPVAQIVSVIIKNGVDSRASDIHVEPYENESRVRYRVDGILKNALFLPKNIHNAVVARIKVLAKMKMDETRVPQDGRIVLTLDNREIDFRISTLPIGNNKEKVVLRILDTVNAIVSLKELGFNSYVLSTLEKNIKKTNGIILSTGPTGSGKTTTLYSIINVLNKEGVNISTLEDPVEYQIKGINQSQIRPKIGYSFATGLRSLVRQDPDIIMVGEIRDDETAELSVHAGLTGHLVLSTLHTNDALGTIFRLLDMKVEPILLASILRVVVAQRLIRKICPHCRKEVGLEEKKALIIKAKEELFNLKPERILKEIPSLKDINNFESLKLFHPVGCSRCQETGYLGRTVIGEAIEIDENLRSLIINNINEIKIENVKKSQEFISIKQDGLFKVLNGESNLEEILRVIEV
ncbi:MAG: GspE/PulE family protein [Patescibacteria group bacterium]|nr:GspE/PulE family protein [Patescibacteria group bacterium]